jgi:hypothetical protein
VIFTVHLNQEERWKGNGGPENESSSTRHIPDLKQGHAQRSSHSRSQLGAFVRSQKETKQWSTQKVQVPTKSLNLLLGDKI